MPRRTNRSALWTHLIRWEPLAVEGSEGRAWIKTLAKDEETGARTALIKYDSGFRQKRTKSNWPVDSYVIEGSMTSGEHEYAADTFHFRPAGVEYGPIESQSGITRVVFTGDTKDGSSDEEVFIQDIKQMHWGPSYADPTGVHIGLKTLRQDPKANYSILLHASFTPGARAVEAVGHVHDHTEEAYILAGDFEDYLGDIEGHINWMPGIYVCRPPGESWHGDSLFLKTPVQTLIRRQWTGQSDKFYDTINKHSPGTPIMPVDFAE